MSATNPPALRAAPFTKGGIFRSPLRKGGLGGISLAATKCTNVAWSDLGRKTPLQLFVIIQDCCFQP